MKKLVLPKRTPTTWVIGVDPSTKVLAFMGGPLDAGDDDPTSLYPLLVPIRGEKEAFGPVILARAYSAVSEFSATLPLAPDDKIFCAIEDGIVGRGGVRTAKVLVSVSAVLQVSCQHRQFSPFLVNVSAWKKDLTSSGNASKDVVAEYLRRHRRAVFARLMEEPGGTGESPRQDLLDAFGVRAFAVGRLRASRGLAAAS